jgi:hypothetical protein
MFNTCQCVKYVEPYPELSFSGSSHNGHSTAVIGQKVSTLGPHSDQLWIEVTNTTQVYQRVITWKNY